MSLFQDLSLETPNTLVNSQRFRGNLTTHQRKLLCGSKAHETSCIDPPTKQGRTDRSVSTNDLSSFVGEKARVYLATTSSEASERFPFLQATDSLVGIHTTLASAHCGRCLRAVSLQTKSLCRIQADRRNSQRKSLSITKP